MPPELWKTYFFRGMRVTVTQQWHDSFGRPMVRIEADDGRGDALSKTMFEQDAIPAPDAPP